MNIWIYGCSFSAGFQKLKLSDKVWSHQLDIGKEYKVKNRAYVAESFYQTREKLLQDIEFILPEDLIIFQLTSSERVYVPYFKEEFNHYFKARDWHLPKGDKTWLPYIKDVEGLDKTLIEEASTIFNLLTALNLNFVWWHAWNIDKDFIEKYKYNRLTFKDEEYYLKWIENHPKLIYTKGDCHQNKDGHRLMAKIFSPQIRNHLGLPELNTEKVL